MAESVLARLGLDRHPRVVSADRLSPYDPSVVVSENPATGKPIAGVRTEDRPSAQRIVAESAEVFKTWRSVPAPVRGQLVRAVGDEIRAAREDLGELVSLEVGKIRTEGVGEIQEIIDIADFAVGLSRQLPGLTIPSERAGHHLRESWHPLGLVGVITAFNFPAAVWGWNAMLAAVCGDVTIWKPSALAPLTALACQHIAEKVATRMGHPGIFRLVFGADDDVGSVVVNDPRIALVSATGSCRMGKIVGKAVADRVGRCLLELGGNNACIVHHDADLDLALKAVLFGAVGTAGQRCTTTRRLLIHESIADRFVDRLATQYAKVRIGDPLEKGTLVGPLIHAGAVQQFLHAIGKAREQGGRVICGGGRVTIPGLSGHYVQPAIVRAPASNLLPIAAEETFAPILYVFTYRDEREAIELNNAVVQGLSSAVFTGSLGLAEKFLSATGSDCGIANVNCGTSGAEIGGAFGGEKETGGGRESGSDSWKAYMRRQTSTINYSGGFTLAQGITFDATDNG